MSKIIGKKEEAKKVEVKAETKAVAPVAKKLTPIKKAAEAVAPANKAEAILKDETKSPVEAAKEIIAEAEKPKAERPTMPANFCMDQKDWEGTGVCYDPSSNNCKTCEKDFPETTTICKARSEFLGNVVKAGKTAKAKKVSAGKATRTPKNGIAPQSVRIDEMLKTEKPLADMISALAKTDFGGDTEAGKKAAETRVQSHIKAIRTGTYCRADLMKPFVSYLATATPAAPAPAKA